MRIIINCSKPRLSDEEMDPIEMDDFEGVSGHHSEGWLPWDWDDLIDIRRVIEERMHEKQREILDAFLQGLSYNDIGVTEKYWRYHYQKAVEFIKEELKL